MRHNRIGIVLAVLLSAVALSGCLNVKDLDEKQSDLIAEYSAGVLLRYSDTYERRLITREQAAEDDGGTQEGIADSKTATPSLSPSPVSTAPPGQTAAAEETPGPEETAQEVSLDELYGIDGLKFSYESYEFCSRYPKNSSDSTIVAEDGETMLVVTFRIRNVSGADKKVNLMKSGITYPLEIDGAEYQPSLSMLDNGGLNYLDTKIPAGRTETAVLIYNLSKEKKNASSISLAVEKGKNRVGVTLK